MSKKTDKPAQPRPIECPNCGCRHFYVIRVRYQLAWITRRRECRHCKRRITTRESVSRED